MTDEYHTGLSSNGIGIAGKQDIKPTHYKEMEGGKLAAMVFNRHFCPPLLSNLFGIFEGTP